MPIRSIRGGIHNYFILGLLVLVTVAIRIPILMEPWGADQAGFGHVAAGMLEGKIPYKDLYSLAGYGVIFTFALFFKVFGVNMVSVHIGHIVVSIITVSVIYFLTNRLYGRKEAIIASFCYTIFSNGLAFSGFGYENKSAWGTYWYISQREVFMAPLITGAILLNVIDVRSDRILKHLISGVLIGLSASYKITAILLVFLLTAFIIYEESTKDSSYNVKEVGVKILLFLSGFLVIQLPFIYYFWVNDALRDIYQELVVHLSVYAKLSRGLRIETVLSGHYSVLVEDLALWLFAFISALYILFKDRSNKNILIVSWALCSLLMVWGQGKFFGYHFIILVPPFAVLAGYGLPRVLTGGSGLKGFIGNTLGDIRKNFMLTMAVVSLIGFGIANYDYYRWHGMYLFGKISREEYYSVFNEFPTHPYSFRSDYQIVKYLRDNYKSGEKLGIIFSAGDTIIPFLTGLLPATRFTQSWYLFSSDEGLCNQEITVNLRKEFVDQLISSAPKFILCVHIPLEELVEISCLKEDPSVRRLSEFVHNNYLLEKFPDNRFLFKKV